MTRATALRSAGAIAVLAVLLVAIAFLTPENSGDNACSPTAVRPWAAADFDDRMRPSPPAAWPTLSSSTKPSYGVTLSPTKEGTRLSLVYSETPKLVKPNWSLYERLEAGPGVAATLPYASGLSVELLHFRVADGPWLSPLDGTPLDPQPTDSYTQVIRNGYEFAVAFKGDEIRAHGASLFDASTKVSLSTGSSWSHPSGPESVAKFSINTHAKPQGDLIFELPLTYGPCQTQLLDLTEGSKVHFDTDLVVDFLARGPGGIRSTFTSDKDVGFDWQPSYGKAGKGWATVVCFPFEASQKIQARALGKKSWESLHGTTQVAEIRDVPVSAQQLEVRYLPHAVRVQFRVPRPSMLAPTENLLDAELGTLELDGPWRLEGALSESLQIERTDFHRFNLDTHTFPMTVKDATPRALLAIAREYAEQGTRVDMKNFRVAGPAGSLAERFAAWIEVQARRLGF